MPLALGACDSGDDDGDDDSGDAGDTDGADDGDGQAEVTWHKDIAPLVAEHCVSCHKPGGIGPFSLEDYASAAPFAGLMAARVEAGEMPPWGAVSTDDCEPRFGWRDDQRLTADEEALLQKWVDLEAPEGDPESATPVPEAPVLDLTDATHTVEPEVGYATSGDADEFVCFVLDPGIDQDTWITGLHMVPSNLEVAHHAVLTVVPPAGQADILAKVGPDGYYECFGGVTSPGSFFAGVWVPGSLPFETPTGVGIPLPASSLLVVQMHYHPAGRTHDPDATKVQLRVTDQQPAKQLLFTAVGNVEAEPILLPGPDDDGAVEFRVPAGIADHTETMRFPISLPGVTQRFPILSAFPHMHYVGVDLDVKILRRNPAPGEPAEECLVKVPAWDFSWQRTYQYDTELDNLPTVGDGDEITIRCRYDNTVENPFVQRALQEADLEHPIDVFLGEETLDEMCLAAFGVVFDAPPAAAPRLMP
ncbi:MAG TPA: hypothetical protein VK698_39060 [Kofleriaceae bacterium]|nr:hypothetical protein [Kofleriaceae bacterium]